MSWRKRDQASPEARCSRVKPQRVASLDHHCAITDADPGRVFAFDVRYLGLPIAHWRYDIAPDGGGCRVTERTWDRRPGWLSKTARLATGVPDREAANTEHIRATLERLKERPKQLGWVPTSDPIGDEAIGEVVDRPAIRASRRPVRQIHSSHPQPAQRLGLPVGDW